MPTAVHDDRRASSVGLRLLRGEPDEMRELQRLFDGSPSYTERVTGLPPGPADAQSLYSALPPGKAYDDKFVFGIFDDDRIVGCADVIRAYPDPHTALVGLLWVAEPFQRRGIGKAAYRRIEQTIRSWGDAFSCVRIGVVRTNDRVLPFWTTLGFVTTGEVKPYRYANLDSETIVLVKPLERALIC